MQKKKVLLVVTKSNWGGAQRYVYDLATHLPENKFDVVVAFGGTGKSGSAPGKLAELLERDGIRTIFIPELGRDINLKDDYYSFRSLLHLLKVECPDVLHLNSSKIGGIGALAGRLAGIPRIIFSAHGWAFGENRSLWQKILIYFLSYISSVLAHLTIVIHQKDLRATYYWPLPPNKVRLIHNGIGEFPKEEREHARNTLAKNTSGFWLGTIGELHTNNNLFTAIDAVVSYNRDQKEKIRFIIIGAGEEQEKLATHIKKVGAQEEIILAGFQPNAASLLTALDAFLFVPKKAGLPYALLEAGAVGLPVIAGATGGIPDIIEHNKTGVLLPHSDKNSIKQAMRELLSNYSLNLGEKLREKVRDQFSLEREIAETIASYKA